MNLYPLVFSNNPKYRITRHILFWLSLILYDTVFAALSWTRFPFEHAFAANFFVELFSFPLDMAFCYAVIYFLIPHYLFRGKYIVMLLYWLLFSLIFILLFRLDNLYVSTRILAMYGMTTHTHSASFTWEFFDLFSQINMEGCMAASIKLGKMWYIKGQELNLLKQEKRKSERQADPGNIQPFFLLNALDRVESLSAEEPHILPGMIGKLKHLLLYVVYDNNQARVQLEKELQFLQEYLDLEKACSREKIDIRTRLSGSVAGEAIAPFIILPLVATSFHQLAQFDLKEKFVDLDIRLNEGRLYLQLRWSKPVDTSALRNGSHSILHHIDKRLNLLYPQSHEMKVIIKTDQFGIDCAIDLHAAVN
jgi:LytS/YehU family sensor histidine kinase